MIFGPIDHVGCASASSTVTDSSSSRDRLRNGPPDAVRTTESTRLRAPALEALEEGRVLAVDREQQPPTPLPRGEREVAGGDEALLVRERERHAALERPERRADPGEADDRVQHEVRLGRLEQLGEVAADLDVLDAERRRELVERLRAGCEGADGRARDCAAITSSACRPIEPVAPSSAIRLSRTVEG